MEIQRVPEGAASVLLSDFDRSNAADGGEDNGFSPTASPPRIAEVPSVGVWPCSCGQRYRVLSEPLTFWAQNSRSGYRSEPSTACVSCGADLPEAFGLEAARLVSASLFG
jgi:hypothetical protein